ncbi:MAG TPA: hypothetical protein DDW50_16270 [Firmicutes bacterium]|nr:hypothetical protein [Bacillota bacterium]
MFMPSNKFKKWVNEEVAKKLDQDGFLSLPLKMRIGIFMMLGSCIIGYGFPMVLMIIAGVNHQLSSGLFQGSIAYGVSWIVGAVGLTLAGRDCIKYPIYFFAKFMKKVFPNYFLE